MINNVTIHSRYIFNFLALPLLLALLGACSSGEGGSDHSPVPFAPRNIVTAASDGQVSISWDNVDYATSYNIYWNNSGNVTKSDNKITNVTSPYTHPDYSNDVLYYYVVTAVGSAGESPISVEGAAVSTLMTNIGFADSNLQACVDIVAATWSFEITDLFCSNKNISDLSGIEYLTSLHRNLQLSYNNISDLSPLSTLTNLQYIAIGGNNISDVSPLAALPNLYIVYVGSNNITDVSQFSSFQKLGYLELGNSGLTDLTALAAAVPNIGALYLGGNNLADLSQLSAFKTLFDLDLSNSGISDISQLAPMTNIISLRLDNNSITDLSQFSTFTQLGYLSLSNNGISDVTQLATLTKLITLWLVDNNITTGVASLVTLTNATSINLSGNVNIPCADLDTLVATLGSSVTVPASCIP